MKDFKGRGFKLHYVEQGDGAPVVFLHGIVMDHTMYAAQFEELPDTYRCIALDSRGHGRSDTPDGPWSMRDCVDDVSAFIEGVDAAPCHLVGMSWGGMTAIPLALQRPDLVRSLVCIDTSAGAERPDWAELERWYMTEVEKRGLHDEELVASSVPIYFGARYQTEHPEGIAAYIDRVRSMKSEAAVEGLRAVIERDSVLDRLTEIRVPTLVIHGTDDASIPMAEAEAIANGIPGAELVQIPGAGHTTPIEAPDAVNDALTKFLARAS